MILTFSTPIQLPAYGGSTVSYSRLDVAVFMDNTDARKLSIGAFNAGVFCLWEAEDYDSLDIPTNGLPEAEVVKARLEELYS
jgi:hypothetical protein